MTFLLLALIIPFFIALWVASDARKRGYSKEACIGWFLGVWFLLIVFLPLYLILRSRSTSSYPGQKIKVCPYCGRLLKEYVNFCPYCGEKLR